VQATLVKSPLRTSPSMTLPGAATAEPTTEVANKPLAYMYADWKPEMSNPAPLVTGHYNAETQTWDAPAGVINAGHWSNSKIPLCCGGWYVAVDDACA
jgi:hypothetical protein